MKRFSIRSLFVLITLVAVGLFVYLPATVTVHVADEFAYGFCNVSDGEGIYAVATEKDGTKTWLPSKFVKFTETDQTVTLRVSRLNSFQFSRSTIYDFSFDPEHEVGCIWHFPDVRENPP
jgi:hypothetical protein